MPEMMLHKQIQLCTNFITNSSICQVLAASNPWQPHFLFPTGVGAPVLVFRCFYPWLYAYVPGEARALPRQSHFEAWYQHKFVPLYICPYRPCDSCPSKFPPISPNCCRRNPLCSSLSDLHIWGRPHHFGRIPPAVNMPRPNKSSFSPVFRKWGTHPPGAPGGRGCSGRTYRPRPSSSARRPLLHTTWS